MPLERWNGTRYESVDLSLADVDKVPTAGWVYADGRWRKVYNRPILQPLPYQSNAPGTIERSVYTTVQTRTVTGTGQSDLTVSWAWPSSSSSLSHNREIRVMVNGAFVRNWTWTGSTAAWSSSGSVSLVLYQGDVITVQAYTTSATTAARRISSVTSQMGGGLAEANPRPEARLWLPFTSSGGLHAGIERPALALQGSPTWSGDVITFAANQRVFIPSATTSLPTGFTYAFWMKTTTTATGRRTVLHQAPETGTPNPEAYIVHNQTSATQGFIVTGLRLGAKVSEFASGVTWPTGVWIHVAVVWSRPTTTSWNRLLFVDGRVRNDDTGTGFPTTPSLAGNEIKLGSAEWAGQMDDFGYWDRPLSIAEVQRLYLMKDPADLP